METALSRRLPQHIEVLLAAYPVDVQIAVRNFYAWTQELKQKPALTGEQRFDDIQLWWGEFLALEQQAFVDELLTFLEPGELSLDKERSFFDRPGEENNECD